MPLILVHLPGSCKLLIGVRDFSKAKAAKPKAATSIPNDDAGFTIPKHGVQLGT